MISPPEIQAVPARSKLLFVIFGLSITSSWGNGHAVTYRGLVRELTKRGHSVIFLERDMPWYSQNRDLPKPPYGKTYLYQSFFALKDRFTGILRRADLTIVGSYVPDGIEIGQWVVREARGATAFYDIDTPVTLATLGRGENGYISSELIRAYDLYLSFTGGPILDRLQRRHGARMARALYCSVDPEHYFHEPNAEQRWDLGYMGTYSDDRQPVLDEFLIRPARVLRRHRFVVAGSKYPGKIRWPSNVERIEHLSPAQHRSFYNAQRFTLNVTRAEMVRVGWSPSVRLFEAAACGTPILSDRWPGLDSLFTPEQEILIAHNATAAAILQDMPEDERRAIGLRARERVLSSHTAAHRAAELEELTLAVLGRRAAA